MKDYLPYIKKASESHTTYEDVVNGVIKELGDVPDTERHELEDAVVNYMHLSKEDANAMWASNENFPDIEASVEEALEKKALSKEAQPFEEQPTPFQFDPMEVNRLAGEFLAKNLKTGLPKDQGKALKNFLDTQRMSIYFKPVMEEVQKRRNQIATEQPERIEKPTQNKKASTILDELSAELKADGEDEASDAVKDLL